MSPNTRKQSSGVLMRTDTTQAVQSQKKARSLNFQIYEEEGLYYLSSENKGVQLLHGAAKMMND